eukprot:Hpha_TRINITY_DN16741_c1_g4::TRINITY_DN16741_c1_g4_i1::g.78335::m.78335
MAAVFTAADIAGAVAAQRLRLPLANGHRRRGRGGYVSCDCGRTFGSARALAGHQSKQGDCSSPTQRELFRLQTVGALGRADQVAAKVSWPAVGALGTARAGHWAAVRTELRRWASGRTRRAGRSASGVVAHVVTDMLCRGGSARVELRDGVTKKGYRWRNTLRRAADLRGFRRLGSKLPAMAVHMDVTPPPPSAHEPPAAAPLSSAAAPCLNVGSIPPRLRQRYGGGAAMCCSGLTGIGPPCFERR